MIAGLGGWTHRTVIATNCARTQSTTGLSGGSCLIISDPAGAISGYEPRLLSGPLSNGRTPVFGTGGDGSNPSGPIAPRHPRRGGEIGKHRRLKISRAKALAGSIPAFGIINLQRNRFAAQATCSAIDSYLIRYRRNSTIKCRI